MTITAKVVAHSQHPNGQQIATMELVYPRFIHSEFMTHRVFSRNASSSRAIPIERMIADIEKNPAAPIHWGRNMAGMQARDEVKDTKAVKKAWHNAMLNAIESAKWMHELGMHKQVTNRLLEPFQHIRVLVTSTEWDNFFALRDHSDAQPEIQALAKVMKAALRGSTPRALNFGQWHIPYITHEDARLEIMTKLKVSVARCARVSYKTTDGEASTIEKDVTLYDRLMGATPIHASPAEHQAMALEDGCFFSGNLNGEWFQLRKLIENGACND